MLVYTRTTRTTRQCLCPLERLIAWASVSLMRCIFPLDNILCRLDSACVHSHDSTTDCLGPSLTTTCFNLLSLPNEMHFSTQQYSLSTRQCLCPLVRLVQIDKRFLRFLLWMPYINLLSLATEKHFSTR